VKAGSASTFPLVLAQPVVHALEHLAVHADQVGHEPRHVEKESYTHYLACGISAGGRSYLDLRSTV
jgi:hypothetical protein